MTHDGPYLLPMDPLVELVDRQADFLLRQTDSQAFLMQVEAFLRALRTEPRLNAYLDDVLQEVADVVEAMERVDTELSSELVELRGELVELRPEADDSDAEPPTDPGPGRIPALAAYRTTLAFFDELVGSEPSPFNADGEGGRTKALLSVLQNKDAVYLRGTEAAASEGDDRAAEPIGTEEASGSGESAPNEDEPGSSPDPLDRWRTRLGNVQRRYDHARRSMILRLRTSPGLALLELEAIPEALNPPARLLDIDAHGVTAADDVLRWVSSPEYPLFKGAWRERLDSADRSIIDKRVADLRESIDRLREDLRRRIGTTRSRLALVNRFKQRCEWHDRERMLAVADDPRLSGGPEDRLTAEFARYLFDAGLSPLTKPLAAGLQPDLLDPLASFYVEAKQYTSSSGRGEIIKAVAQVLDTVGRLRGGPFAVDEAFCVIFRRNGAYYDLPEVLQTETYRLYLVLIDLAPTAEAGRRQKDKPVRIPAEEFFAAEIQADERSRTHAA